MEQYLQQKVGRVPLPAEVAWNLAKQQAPKSSPPGLVYYQMALFLNKLGENHVPVLRKAAEVWLLNEQRNPYGPCKVQISDCGEGSCSACRKQHGRILSIDEALRLMPVPCKDCTTELYSPGLGFCRCSYIVYIP